MGQVFADRYELKETVGTGGMSTVYCAFDTLLERNVALKILHEQYGDDEELGLEIGRALAFAHSQGLIHRDVKPQNVLLNGDGRAKVTDFGIVRSLDAVGHTETGTVLGTSHYNAPEQARGERVDAQTDVYSFGVVLYELLAGQVPYPGENFLSVAMKHVNDPVPSVLDARPDTPLRLATLIERSLAKEPAERPASMRRPAAPSSVSIVRRSTSTDCFDRSNAACTMTSDSSAAAM